MPTNGAVRIRKQRHDAKHEDVSFEEADRVYYRHASSSNLKFTAICDGPFCIVKKISILRRA